MLCDSPPLPTPCTSLTVWQPPDGLDTAAQGGAGNAKATALLGAQSGSNGLSGGNLWLESQLELLIRDLQVNLQSKHTHTMRWIN